MTTGGGVASEYVLVFLRAPDIGRVKTRLARFLGNETAAALYGCFVADLMATLAECGRPVWLFYTPADAGERIRSWLGDGYPMSAQRGADLGFRMANAFADAFKRGVQRAVLVGTDVPDLPRTRIPLAFDRLFAHPAVIGPSPDGGYHLIGFTAEGFFAEAFNGLPWGTSRVMEAALAAFRREQRRPYLLQGWCDIDRIQDLAELKQRLDRRPETAPATAAFLAERFAAGLPEKSQRRPL